MPSGISLQQAKPPDIGYIIALLSKNDLPTTDIPNKLDSLYICTVGSDRVGVGGLEQYGDVALLRSIVIKEEHRGNGYGTRLSRQMLRKASSSGISTVYLLTTTASEFFSKLGYERVDRESVADPIQQSSEFRDLCPSSADCMKFELGKPDADSTIVRGMNDQ